MSTNPQVVDFNAIKRAQQQMWNSGDYGNIGSRIVIMSEQLCEAIDLRSGMKVLDVATGTGNAALAAARRFCDVTGVDYVPALLDHARLRAEAEGLPVMFQEGDAEDLPFPDDSFDAVMSVVGAMFAPNQEKVAQELLRVCRSGGKVGMANWTPDGFIGDLFRVTARYVPPAPGVKPASLWGTEERLQELFGDKIQSLQVTRRSYMNRFKSPEHYVAFFRINYGPILKAFERLDSSTQANLERDLIDLVGQVNQAEDGTAVWPADYLEVLAIKR